MESNELTEKEIAEVKKAHNISDQELGRKLHIFVLSLLILFFLFSLWFSLKALHFAHESPSQQSLFITNNAILVMTLSSYSASNYLLHIIYNRRMAQLYAIIRKLDAQRAESSSRKANSDQE